MTDLLDAVDALTLPVTQKRIKELDHDHDWFELLQEIPRDEYRARVRAARKAGEPVPERMQKTGEWWCMWCDEVRSMPVHAVPQTETVKRTDPCLLEQLEAAVASSIGSEKGSSSQRREQVPLDLGAFEMSRRIRGDVEAWLLDMGAMPGTAISLAHLVRAWYAMSLAHPEDTSKVRVLRGWASEIRNHFDRPAVTEITAICPECMFAFVITNDDTRQRALQGVSAMTWDATTVACRVCGKDWTGRDALAELANATRRLEGTEELASPPINA